MRHDPRVDDYIAQAPPFARPILLHLRSLWAQAVPDGEESIKWNMPHLVLRGRNVAGMAALKNHCALMLHGEPRRGDAMGQFGRIGSLDHLPPDEELLARLQSNAAAAAAAGRNV